MKSAPFVLDFEGNRLALFEFLLRFLFRRKSDNTPIDVSTWGLELKATYADLASFNHTLSTTIESTGTDTNDELRCLAITPRAAGLTPGSDSDTRQFVLWLSRAGSVGRKLIARITLTIDPAPDNEIYKTGTLDPETFVIVVDEGEGLYEGEIADPLAIYDALFTMVNGKLLIGSATNAQALAQQAAPLATTLVEVAEDIEVNNENHPKGKYFKNLDGSVDRINTIRVNPS